MELNCSIKMIKRIYIYILFKNIGVDKVFAQCISVGFEILHNMLRKVTQNIPF